MGEGEHEIGQYAFCTCIKLSKTNLIFKIVKRKSRYLFKCGGKSTLECWYNPSTLEVEAGGSIIAEDHLQPHSLSNMRYFLKKLKPKPKQTKRGQLSSGNPIVHK